MRLPLRLLTPIVAVTLALVDVCAQNRLVSEVKKDISSQTMTADGYRKAKNKLSPALEHTESREKAVTWWVAGNIDLGIYDKMMDARTAGKKVDGLAAASALLEGYDEYARAMTLDTVFLTDKHGRQRLDKQGYPKYRTQYSDKIMRALYGHLVDYSAAGGELFIAGDWERAYHAWDVYYTLARSPLAARYKVNEPDSVVGYYRYYQGLAAHQGWRLDTAMTLYREAELLGYVKKRVYDSWIDAALRKGDTMTMVEVATRARSLYGDSDIHYLRILINDCLTRKEYAGAAALLNAAIKNDPNNAEYYDLQGQIVERLNNITDAMPFYRHAVELNPNYAIGQFNYGNALYRKALLLENHRGDEAQALYREAAEHVEQAYRLGMHDENTRQVLARLYYLLNSEKIDAL